MRRQITRGFHSLKGKINKAFTQDVQSGHVAEELQAQPIDLEKQDKSGTRQGASAKLIERREFERIVNEELAADRGQGCLLVADVDRFRTICGIYGQDAGDLVLQRVADVLRDMFPEAAYMLRQGRDTFALWIPDVSSVHTDRLYRQTGRINDLLLHPAEGFVPVTLSSGIAFNGQAEDCRSLGRKAVKALNCVKESGRCGCEIYDSSKLG